MASRILIVDADSGEVTEARGVGGASRRLTNVVWSGAGDELVYGSLSTVAEAMTPDSIVALDPLSGERRDLLWERGSMTSLAIAAPGTLVFAAVMRHQPLVLAALDGSGSRPLTHGSSVDRQPAVSPDGSRALFSSSRSGNLDLWAVTLETGELARLTEDAAPDWDPAWSHDGQQILWSSGRSGNLEIWMASADGSGARQITRDGVDAENPTLTRDGWIVYSTANPDWRGLHKVRVDGSDDTLLVPGIPTLPEVSPDGRHVAYLTQFIGYSDVTGLTVTEIESGRNVAFEARLTIPDNAAYTSNYGRARWTPDGAAIVFAAADEHGQWGLLIQDFDPVRDTSHTRRLLLDLGPGTSIESFGLTPDGLSVVASRYESIRSIMLAENVPGVGPAR